MVEGRSQVHNVVLIYTKMESIVAKQAACIREQLVAKEFSTLVSDFSDDFLQYLYKKTSTGDLSVTYDVAEQMLFNLLRVKVRNKILDKHIVKYSDTRDISNKVVKKLLFTKAFMAAMAAFTQRRASGAIAAERIFTMMEKR